MWSANEPLPEERGELGPPSRKPPTAVGTATPPPPRRRHDLWRTLVPLPIVRPALTATSAIGFGAVITIAPIASIPAALGLWLVAAGVTLLAQLWVRIDNAPLKSWNGSRFRAYVSHSSSR